MKRKLTHIAHKVAGGLLKGIGLEVHYVKEGYSWHSLPLSKEFLDAYNGLKVAKRTYVSVPSLHAIWQLLRHCLELPGSVGQVGVWKGGSAAMIASLVEEKEKEFHLFDTFEGLPPTREEDNVNGYKDVPGLMADTSVEDVAEYLKDFECVRIHKGYFPDSIPEAVSNETFCFAYLDGDLYQTTKDGLEFFFSHMWPGGAIVVDDYGGRRWAGVKTAVDEFVAANDRASFMQLAAGQCVIIKR